MCETIVLLQDQTFGIGDCDSSCDGKVMISPDCIYGLQCSGNVPDPVEIDGCAKACAGSEYLVQNLTNPDLWSCEPRATTECLGEYIIDCQNPVKRQNPADEIQILQRHF